MTRAIGGIMICWLDVTAFKELQRDRRIKVMSGSYCYIKANERKAKNPFPDKNLPCTKYWYISLFPLCGLIREAQITEKYILIHDLVSIQNGVTGFVAYPICWVCLQHYSKLTSFKRVRKKPVFVYQQAWAEKRVLCTDCAGYWHHHQ